MLLLAPEHLKALADAAERAYPNECCGLLIGRGGRRLRVTRLVASPNLAAGPDRFEVDPGLRLRLMRELQGGRERILGHYHSHPDHPARPSAHDLAMAFEPEFVWVIVSVLGGQAAHTTAHRLDEKRRVFREVAIRAG